MPDCRVVMSQPSLSVAPPIEVPVAASQVPAEIIHTDPPKAASVPSGSSLSTVNSNSSSVSSSAVSSPAASLSPSCVSATPAASHHNHANHNHHHHHHHHDQHSYLSHSHNSSSSSHSKEIHLLQHQLRQQQALTAAARSRIDSLTRTALRIHGGLIRQMDVQHGTYPTRIAVHRGPVTALKFSQMLYKQVPVRLSAKDAFSDLPALEKWTDKEYLKTALKNTKLTVAQTPSGLADAPGLQNTAFLQPHVVDMDATVFLNHLRNPTEPAGNTKDTSGDAPSEITKDTVLYMQSQNDNYPREFPSLTKDAPHAIPWANEALDAAGPAAVNLWLGDYHTTSRLHNDNYENLYVQVSGSKELYLIPPGDAYALDERFLKPLSYGSDMSLRDSFTDEPVNAVAPDLQAQEKWQDQTELEKSAENSHSDLGQTSAGSSHAEAAQEKKMAPPGGDDGHGDVDMPSPANGVAGADTVATSDKRNSDTVPTKRQSCGQSTSLFKTPNILFPTVDPSNPLTFNDIYSQNAFVYRVVLQPGDMLYIPALWYHQVRVLDGAPNVSLNYWYAPAPTNGQWMRWDYVRYCSAVLRGYHDPFYFDEEDDAEEEEEEDADAASTLAATAPSSLVAGDEDYARINAKREKVQGLLLQLQQQQQQYQEKLQKQHKLQKQQIQHLHRQQQHQHQHRGHGKKQQM